VTANQLGHGGTDIGLKIRTLLKKEVERATMLRIDCYGKLVEF
jgi:hypothetical protein